MDAKELAKLVYSAKETPVLLDVPAGNFIAVSGVGDPNGETFAWATAALYSLAYAVRMSYKSTAVPQGYYAYKVNPMEGDWSLADPSLGELARDNWAYDIMIRQPDFLTAELFQRFYGEVARKKPNPALAQARFEHIEEGRCCQALHLGPYANEHATFASIEAFLHGQGLQRASKGHREIYLSDPRKTDPAKLRTILRVQVK